jgi:hypothetical protein
MSIRSYLLVGFALAAMIGMPAGAATYSTRTA